MKEKVLVAMSGGVDSSVAAAMLLEQGYEPIGVTMRLWTEAEQEKHRGCCSLDDVNDARRVADQLGIPHYVMNMKKDFKHYVVDYFVSEYLAGRTPNPCIACNKVLKFEKLLEKARQLGASRLATGHYARMDTYMGKHVIRRGLDPKKDQSYFLFNTPTDKLGYILFPLGGLTKREAREVAARHALKTAEKEESQEICFVPDDDYGKFIAFYQPDIRPGNIVDSSGRVLGTHRGIPFYTIGQRRGLGIGFSHRLYVTAIDKAANTIIVGREEDLYADSMTVENLTMHIPLEAGQEVEVQVRYRHKPSPAMIRRIDDGGAEILFDEPEKAIAPGQAAVFYIGDIIAGGGWIVSSSRHGEEER